MQEVEKQAAVAAAKEEGNSSAAVQACLLHIQLHSAAKKIVTVQSWIRAPQILYPLLALACAMASCVYRRTICEESARSSGAVAEMSGGSVVHAFGCRVPCSR